MKVLVPSPLRSYTAGRSEVEAAGATVDEVLADLDRQYPGIRFRMIDEQGGIRPHIRFFAGQEQVHTTSAPVAGTVEFCIICALSGGSVCYNRVKA